jgi:hypothetical protein
MINEISLLQSVVTCLISCGVGYCRKIWLAGVVGQARPKHVVTIAAINTKPRQLCF